MLIQILFFLNTHCLLHLRNLKLRIRHWEKENRKETSWTREESSRRSSTLSLSSSKALLCCCKSLESTILSVPPSYAASIIFFKLRICFQILNTSLWISPCTFRSFSTFPIDEAMLLWLHAASLFLNWSWTRKAKVVLSCSLCLIRPVPAHGPLLPKPIKA